MALLGHAAASAEPRGPTAGTEVVAIIDLRSAPQRPLDAFTAELARAGHIAPIADPALAAALAGTGSQRDGLMPHVREARRAMSEAGRAYDALDCAAAMAAAERAVTALAALEAAGEPMRVKLEQGYAYLLLCAHNAGNSDMAMRAAHRLHALGNDSPPQGVSAQIWTLYPVLDATTNIHKVEVGITAEPADAMIWLDHRELGPAPLTVLVDEGEHIIAAAAAGSAHSRRIQIRSGTTSIPLTVPATEQAPARPWPAIAELVQRWQAGGQPGPSELGALMTRLGVRVALVLGDQDQVEAWALDPGQSVPSRFGSGAMKDIRSIADAIRDRARRWTDPAGSTTLLVGPDASGKQRSGQTARRQAWWVYASIVGAVALGSAILLANDLADDHQRIELRWP